MQRALRTILALLALAAALAAAACGGSNDTPAASATAATAATRTGTAPSLTEAAARFTALVTPLNAEVRRINADIDKARATDDVTAVVDPLERLSAASGTFADGLRAMAVPPTVQRPLDDALTAAIAQKRALDALVVAARSGSLPATEAQAWTAALYEMSARAAALRTALGLPPAG